MKYVFSVLMLFSIFTGSRVHSQDILLKGDSTSMVNLYGDAKLLSIENNKAYKNGGNYVGKGFRVQIYHGPDRAEADKLKMRFLKKYPKHFAGMVFNSPNYSIRVGNFIKREEAEAFMEDIISAFPNAVVLPDQINISIR